VRIAIVTESFLPHVNGVTNSVLRLLEHLEKRGHEAVVIAPGEGGPTSYAGAELIRLRSLPFPGYPAVRITTSRTATLTDLLAEIDPDVVHLASPFGIGPVTVRAAGRLGIPIVSVFQTDVAGFATRYHLKLAHGTIWHRLEAIHRASDVTLVPSRATLDMLTSKGIPRLALWPRGVDTVRFTPEKRDAKVRSVVSPNGEVVVGYVGRLASEKQVEDLAVLGDLPNVRLAIVGDGPRRDKLERILPDSTTFFGHLDGERLPQVMASFDVVVHPGEHETFCQVIQEAMACGVPAVAPASGGPLDLINPSRTGWLYTPGDLNALRGHVLDLTGDAAKRRAFGEAARETVGRRSWDRIGDLLLAHYRNVIRPRVGDSFEGVS